MFFGPVNLKQIEEKTTLEGPAAEKGIYWDNLSAIIYYRSSLSLKVVLIYRLLLL